MKIIYTERYRLFFYLKLMGGSLKMDHFCRSYDEVFQSQTFVDAVAFAMWLKETDTKDYIARIFDKISKNEELNENENNEIRRILGDEKIMDKAKERFDEISKNRTFNGNARATDMSLDEMSGVVRFTQRLLWTEWWFDWIIDEFKKRTEDIV